MRKIFRNSLIIINLFFVTALLLAYVSVYINPNNFIFAAPFGTAFLALLIVNIGFSIYFAFRRKKMFFLSALAVLLGYNHITEFFGFNTEDAEKKGRCIKVMSYNVRLFNLYNWDKTNNIPQKIYALFRQEQPDILCFQEYYSCRAEQFSTFDSISKILHYPYYHLAYRKEIKQKIKIFGPVIFSKYPIFRTGSFRFKTTKRKFIYADILIGSDTIRVYNVHLASLHLGYDDYRFVEHLTENDKDDFLPGTVEILRKMMRAFRSRALEADFLAKQIAKSKYPVIVCGDLNDVPVSYAYRTVKGNLTDAFSESGLGIGSTYAGKFSLFRIDYIFHSSSLKSYRFKTFRQKYSDHYPVACEIGL